MCCACMHIANVLGLSSSMSSVIVAVETASTESIVDASANKAAVSPLLSPLHDEEEKDMGAAVSPASGMLAYLDAINHEERLTFYFTATHEVAELTVQLSQRLSAATTAVEQAKTALHAEMSAHDLECLQLGPRLFARIVIRQSSGKDLTPDTVQAAASALVDDAIAAVLAAQAAARKAALLKALAAAASAGGKRKRARSGASTGDKPAEPPEEPVLDLSAAACATLCDPQITYAGKNKVPCRAGVPLTRDLKQPELLAEAMYAQLHALHKPRRETLLVSETFPRTEKRQLVTLADAPLAIQKAAGVLGMARDAAARAAAPDTVQSDIQERAARKEWLQHIKPCVHAYVKESGGKLVRIVPLADGTRRTMVAEVVHRERRARSLTLWELSQVLDAVATEWLAAATPDVNRDVFSTMVAARVAAALDAKTSTVELLRTNRGKADTGTAKQTPGPTAYEHTVGGVLMSARLMQDLVDDADFEPMDAYEDEREDEDDARATLALSELE